MNKYSGIDLHSNNCVVAVIDETDRVCCERRIPNDLAQIVVLLAPYREKLVGVVVESTYNWYCSLVARNVYPKEMRSVRDLARKRSQLVRTRTMQAKATARTATDIWRGRLSKQRTLRYNASAKRFYDRKEAKTNAVVAN